MSRWPKRNLYDSGEDILRNWALLREIGRRDCIVIKCFFCSKHASLLGIIYSVVHFFQTKKSV